MQALDVKMNRIVNVERREGSTINVEPFEFLEHEQVEMS